MARVIASLLAEVACKDDAGLAFRLMVDATTDCRCRVPETVDSLIVAALRLGVSKSLATIAMYLEL